MTVSSNAIPATGPVDTHIDIAQLPPSASATAAEIPLLEKRAVDDHSDAKSTHSTSTVGTAPPRPRLPPPALDSASLFSRIFFTWVSPIIAQRETIDENTLNDLQAWDQAEFLCTQLENAWEREQASASKAGRSPHLAWALLHTFRSQIFWSGFWAGVEIATKVGEAVFLGNMIRGFQQFGIASVSSEGYWWALALTLATTFHGILHHAFFFVGMRLGHQLRISLTTIMYKKSINLAAGSTSPGVIVNLVSNDVATFEQLALFGHYLWVAAIEIPLCGWLLYERLSWPALLGLIVIFLMVPMQAAFGRYFHKFRRAMVQWRDARVRLMSDLLTGIDVVKFNAWMTPFVAEVTRLRAMEMIFLIRAGIMDAMNEASFFVFPMLVFLLTYGSSIGAGIPLRAPDVFSSVALFNVLRLTLTTFVPKAVKAATESAVSLNRIGKFLLEQETSSTLHQPDPLIPSSLSSPPTDPSKPAITLTNATFTWPAFQLDSISQTFNQASLTAIIGPVGSGKSSLIQAILGEMPTTSSPSAIHIAASHRRMAYAPQTPWILAGTILDNILFGSELDEPWLRRVLAMCSLERDLDQWPHGLYTLVGERGVSLSGGQKARVGLARAVYAKAPVLLLDDPLSALDSRVGRKVFEAVRSAPELARTTRVLVTHQLHFVREADQVVVMEAGKVAASGTWDEVRDTHKRRVADVGHEEASKDWMAILADYDDTAKLATDMEVDAIAAGDASVPSSSSTAAGSPNAAVVAELRDEMVDLIKDGKRGAAKAAAANVETSQVGRVRWSTFSRFLIQPTSLLMLVTTIVAMFGGQILAVSSDWHLARWVNKPPEVQLGDSFYFTLYWALIAAAVTVGLVRAVLFYQLLLNSSRAVSATMLEKVLDAPLAWFNKNPTGRILNRFTKDLSQIDEQLPTVFFNFTQCLFQSIGVIIVVIMVLPWVALSVPVLATVFFLFRRWYIAASRRIKRIESTTRSPVYSHLSESLEGLPVIRALHAQHMFVHQFAAYMDTNTRAVFAQAACARWLGLRLDLVSSLFLAISAFAAQLVAQSGGLPAALAGLALSYTLQLNGLLQWMVRQSVEVEVLFVACERLFEYCDLTGEKDLPSRDVPPPEWPTMGEIKFKNMSLTYPGSEKPVLKEWNVEFKAGEKIGLVGRTGAGKSSSFAALFRSYEYDGVIELDGINTATLKVEELRRRLSIIPQSPMLFRGSVRFNLDPFNEYSDHEIWQALERVQLKSVVEQLEGKLDAPVVDGGQNFSVGSRQLLCASRSLLKKARVLVADEASANIDFKSDALIQQVLQHAFPDTLVITIAHRLTTVIQYDRLVVLDAGKIMEVGHAWELLQNPNGMFAKMVADTGDEGANQLREMAKASWEAKQR
ncbi:multidrug resistance-associated protein 4-like protein [Catenaria anguillulae PL171]|uniref:Multidrug resistance-associated protein 4-like protein n=1 Tax=Catenaria anguillulae PL171 TaxID=765915 RepID=A0A1Y2HG60_9FUNG|nr:multidrug resistance-associated protein 4-like protein [Catenaria anguillulae PL171]